MNKILAVYKAGRKVDMKQIMNHELIPVLVFISLHGTSSIIINGQSLVVALEKHQECHTFEDLADVFVNTVQNKRKHFERQDITFYRYHELSIKSTTRDTRSRYSHSVRRITQHRGVLLPSIWSNFQASPDNKADMVLCVEILSQTRDKVVVISGGFTEETLAWTSDHHINIFNLELIKKRLKQVWCFMHWIIKKLPTLTILL